MSVSDLFLKRTLERIFLNLSQIPTSIAKLNQLISPGIKRSAKTILENELRELNYQLLTDPDTALLLTYLKSFESQNFIAGEGWTNLAAFWNPNNPHVIFAQICLRLISSSHDDLEGLSQELQSLIDRKPGFSPALELQAYLNILMNSPEDVSRNLKAAMETGDTEAIKTRFDYMMEIEQISLVHELFGYLSALQQFTGNIEPETKLLLMNTDILERSQSWFRECTRIVELPSYETLRAHVTIIAILGERDEAIKLADKMAEAKPELLPKLNLIKAWILPVGNARLNLLKQLTKELQPSSRAHFLYCYTLLMCDKLRAAEIVFRSLPVATPNAWYSTLRFLMAQMLEKKGYLQEDSD